MGIYRSEQDTRLFVVTNDRVASLSGSRAMGLCLEEACKLTGEAHCA
jgi:hypothetical protein